METERIRGMVYISHSLHVATRRLKLKPKILYFCEVKLQSTNALRQFTKRLRSKERIMLVRHALHDYVIKWKHFPRYWPFVRGIHRSVARSFEVFFDLRPNKRLSKQWWRWWFEAPSCPLWHHRNVSRITCTCISCALFIVFQNGDRVSLPNVRCMWWKSLAGCK